MPPLEPSPVPKGPDGPGPGHFGTGWVCTGREPGDHPPAAGDVPERGHHQGRHRRLLLPGRAGHGAAPAEPAADAGAVPAGVDKAGSTRRRRASTSPPSSGGSTSPRKAAWCTIPSSTTRTGSSTWPTRVASRSIAGCRRRTGSASLTGSSSISTRRPPPAPSAPCGPLPSGCARCWSSWDCGVRTDHRFPGPACRRPHRARARQRRGTGLRPHAGRAVGRLRPGRLTTEFRKAKRGARLYLDVARNGYAQTVVAPYTVRARPGAPVATPLDWDEVRTTRLTPDRWTIGNIFRRLGAKADPWRGSTSTPVP